MYKVKYGLVPSNVADIFSTLDHYIWSRLDSKIKDKPTLQCALSPAYGLSILWIL